VVRPQQIGLGSELANEAQAPKSGTVTFIDRNFDELLDLMVEARNYIAYGQPAEKTGLAPEDQLQISFETMRVTARLIRAAAWLSIEKAVRNGELTREDALGDDFTLSTVEACLDPAGPEDETLPKALRSLLDRSYRMYMRIARLEGLARASAT